MVKMVVNRGWDRRPGRVRPAPGTPPRVRGAETHG